MVDLDPLEDGRRKRNMVAGIEQSRECLNARRTYGFGIDAEYCQIRSVNEGDGVMNDVFASFPESELP